MTNVPGSPVVELSATEVDRLSGGSEIGYAIGYAIGWVFHILMDVDPFDGNYYGVGA